jgi:ribose/xylose/arabinose/galactoside ABC-type transport system permease subunit
MKNTVNQKSAVERKLFNSGTFVQFFMDNKALVILILFVIVVNFLTGDFFTSRNLTNIVRQICTSVVLGIGFTMVLSSGQIDLSVGYMLGMIGVLTAMMSVAGVNMFTVILVGLALGALCGFLNAAITTFFNLPPFIVTLATGMIFRGINLLSCKAKSIAGLPEWYVFFGKGHVWVIPFPIFVMLIVVVIMTFVVSMTRFGRYCLAVGGNPAAARVCGINTVKIQYCVYVITGVCVAIAAMLLTGRTASAQTTAGTGMELDAVAAVVIGGTPMSGGKANVMGTVIGCLLVQVISNSLNLLGVDSNWQQVAKGIVIIIAIILDAQGTRLFNRLRIKNTI